MGSKQSHAEEGYPASWIIQRIGDFAAVKGGKRLPLGTTLTEKHTSHPYIRIVDFKDGRIDQSNLMFVPEEVFPLISRYTISAKDIWISIVGTVGLVGLVDDALDGANLTENAAKICNIASHVDKTFLNFFLRSELGLEQIRAQTVGSTQPKLALFRIADIRIPLPPIEEQRAIANILGTLDDKIEINRQQTETLEAMARALFKAWFVDFEPVRAKMEGRWQRAQSLPGLPAHLYDLFPDRLVESELGEVPEGWEMVSASELIEFNPTEPLRKGTPSPYLDMAALPTAGSWPDPPVLREYGSGMRFRNGDTLLARITPCLENGKTAFVQCLPAEVVGWGSTEYIVMRPKKPVPRPYAYLLARYEAFRRHAIRSMTGTSGRQRAQSDAVATFKVSAPSNEKIWQAFAGLVEPSFQCIQSNAMNSESLAQLRDTLLPKLISGNLTITHVN